MKKFVIALCLTLVALPAFAQKLDYFQEFMGVPEHQNTELEDWDNSLKMTFGITVSEEIASREMASTRTAASVNNAIATSALAKYKNSEAGKQALAILAENESNIAERSINTMSTKAAASDYQIVAFAGSNPTSITTIIAAAPSNRMCQDKNPQRVIEPIDGLLMYTTGILEQNLEYYGLDYVYLTNISRGNAKIYPHAWTEYNPTNGVYRDVVQMVKYSTVEPYEVDTIEVYVNNPQNQTTSTTTNHARNNMGCFLVVDTQGNPVLATDHVWLSSETVVDEGKDIFYSQSRVYSYHVNEYVNPPIFTYHYNQRAYPRYIYKIRKSESSSYITELANHFKYKDWYWDDRGDRLYDIWYPFY